MTEHIIAPFSDEQVEALNKYQREAPFHPFTCANRGDGNHVEHAGHSDLGMLTATNEGWVCSDCDYTQLWAHAFMAQPWPPTARIPGVTPSD